MRSVRRQPARRVDQVLPHGRGARLRRRRAGARRGLPEVRRDRDARVLRGPRRGRVRGHGGRPVARRARAERQAREVSRLEELRAPAHVQRRGGIPQSPALPLRRRAAAPARSTALRVSAPRDSAFEIPIAIRTRN